MNLRLSKKFLDHLKQDIYTPIERADILTFVVMVQVYKENEFDKENGIFDGILFLQEELWQKLLLETKLFEIRAEGGFQTTIPVWEDTVLINGNSPKPVSLDWVSVFRDKFKEANPDRWGTLSTCKERMKKFLSKNPSVTEDEVLDATDLYLRNTDRRYIMKSHKFIYDGAGTNLNSTLEEWIEKLREYQTSQQQQVQTTDITEKMQ